MEPGGRTTKKRRRKERSSDPEIEWLLKTENLLKKNRGGNAFILEERNDLHSKKRGATSSLYNCGVG